MIKIVLQNLQAIANAEFEIGDRSITEFVGNNSNGKSILAKVIQSITSGDIRRKEVRQALIKDGKQSALFAINNGNQQLGIILAEELKDSFILYIPNADDPERSIRRGLGDKGALETVLHKFGFRTYAQGDICLQLSPTFGAIPFITTSGAVNGEIVADITTDKVADEFLDSFKNITFPTFRSKIAAAKRERESLETMIASVNDYDWREFESLSERIGTILEAIKNYKFIRINDIPVPMIGFDLMDTPKLKEIPIIKTFDKAPRLGFLDSEITNLVAVLNDTCPTCGRKFIEREVLDGTC